MIPAQTPSLHQNAHATAVQSVNGVDWMGEMRRAITSSEQLLAALSLPTNVQTVRLMPDHGFPVRVPLPYLAKMKVGDSADPLLRQVLPISAESLKVEGFGLDAVGDLDAVKTRGLLQKYDGRALVIASAACAVNCRFCFRRHFPYSEQSLSHSDWAGIVEQLRKDSSITEVILSGGDPLVLSDRRLEQIAADLAEIPHLKRLRIHSRLPVVIPARVTDQLCATLNSTRLSCVLVMHINHANEIDAALIQACKSLQQANVNLLNQSVLLAGVNDNLAALTNLSERLLDAGIIPYYLHLLDKIQGAAHFAVPDDHARLLMSQLQSRLPGYLCPKWVREEPGKPSKTPFV